MRRRAASTSAAATPSSSRASSARPPTSSPRTTCAPARATFRARACRAPRRRRARSSSPPRRSRAPRCCGSSPRRGWASTSPPAASSHLALRAGFEPGGDLSSTATRSPRPSCDVARAGRRHVVVDNPDELERLERLVPDGAAAAVHAPRHARASSADTHDGDLDRPGRPRSSASRLDDAPRGDRAPRARRDWARPAGPAPAHRLAALRPRRRSARRSRRSPALGDFPALQPRRRPRRRLHAPSTGRRSIDEYVAAKVERRARAARRPDRRSSTSPAARSSPTPASRSTRSSRSSATSSTWVARRRRHVRQPAPDALRRALRGRGRRPRSVGAGRRRAATSPASTASPAT